MKTVSMHETGIPPEASEFLDSFVGGLNEKPSRPTICRWLQLPQWRVIDDPIGDFDRGIIKHMEHDNGDE